MSRSESRQIHMSVEGKNCERLYFEHLAKLINCSDRHKYDLKISPRAMSPLQYAKRSAYKPVDKRRSGKNLPYIHIQDIEDYYDAQQKQKFYKTIDEMRRAEQIFGISYCLGYSNYTFELWMLLHAADMTAAMINRAAYLRPINQYFKREYRSLDEFKNASEFQRLLKQFITLDSVFDAVDRAERIAENNKRQGKNSSVIAESHFIQITRMLLYMKLSR